MTDSHLKRMPYKTTRRRSAQMSFGTIKNTPDAADGDISDELNISSSMYPVISARNLYQYKTIAYPGTKSPIVGSDGHELFVCNGTRFYYGFDSDGKPHAVSGMELSDDDSMMPKRVVVMYRTIVVYPDKLAYNTETGAVVHLDASVPAGSVGTADSETHVITFSGTNPLASFAAGDVVTIEASGEADGDSRTLTADVCIKDITGSSITLESIQIDGVAKYEAWPFDDSHAWTVTSMQRTAPVLETCCSVGNRVFGTVGNQIWASKLGDVTNWTSYQGISTDSWYLDTGNAEPFTGAAVIGSRPVFFTETKAVILYGSLPSNYSTSEVVTHGVMEGAQSSIVAADGYLYYLSLFGLCRFSASSGAAVISDDLGVTITSCLSATDGRSILFSCTDSDGWRHNYRYDIKRGIFTREDDRQFTSICRLRGVIYGIEDNNNRVTYYLWRMERDAEPVSGWEIEDYMDVQLDFAPFREDSSAGTVIRDKSAAKLIIRYDAYMAPMQVSVKLGSDQPYTVVWAEENCMGVGVAVIPIPRNRSDGVQVSISSVIVPGARFRVLGMAREYNYFGGS